jgi:hypothetical protein
MSSEELHRRLLRLEKWSQRYDRLLDREGREVEALFVEAIQEWDIEKRKHIDAVAGEESRVKSQLDQAGKEYSQTKYRLERDTNANRAELKRIDDEYRDLEKKYSGELARIKEEDTKNRISLEKQRSALTDLYQEKMRHLTVTRAGLQREWQNVEAKVRETRKKSEDELRSIEEQGTQRIKLIKDQASAKQEGWSLALETLKKELASLAEEKDHVMQRLSTVKEEKEKELNSARTSMAVSREQLEVDKATLIEKAEADQRRCEAEVADLKTQIDQAERSLQDFVGGHERRKKDTEESFLKEESMLKDAVRAESDKRDYEQKLFEQEKNTKEKELNRLKEEYEKKKWHWDNQIRSLMMQKAVHDSEHDAERLRVDREARTALRALEGKRDELKQRLADLKNRHTVLSTNADKELQLINQRWTWRRDRLWTLWQNRLEILRKERSALQDQIDALQQKFEKERRLVSESENRDTQRTDQLQNVVMEADARQNGFKKQKEIQIELEKTRVLAQIKECETLIMDWMDRLKQTQETISRESRVTAENVGFLDRWYRDEAQETEQFLHSLQNAMSVIHSSFENPHIKKAA